jgi:hypothetical protein
MLFIGRKILEQATLRVFVIYRISVISARLHVCTDPLRLTRFQAKQFQTDAVVINNVQKTKTAFLTGAPNFSFCERKIKEVQLGEEYCWAITECHDAADKLPVCWILFYQLDSFYKFSNMYSQV